MRSATGKLLSKAIAGILIILVLVLLDQLSKQAAVEYLKNSPDLILIPGVLQLHYLENTGAAFSLLEGKMTLFYITTPILAALLAYLYLRTPARKRYLPLLIVYLFLIAGALGNLIDRILYQYVIDFIYFSLINFPVFNVADIYVTCSTVVLFLLILFYFQDMDELTDLYLPGRGRREEKSNKDGNGMTDNEC